MITPGPQNPHCSDPFSSNNCWSGCSCSLVASPSIVSTSRPSACTASIRHELTDLPSTITVQAPQSPTSQPSLDPVNSNSSRSIRRRVVSGATCAVRRSPLTRMVTSAMSLLLRAGALSLSEGVGAFQGSLGQYRDEVAAIVGGGTHVADRLRVAGGELARLFHRLRRDRAPVEEAFSAGRVDHLRGDGAKRHARGLERVLVPVDPDTRGDVDERQRLSLAQAELQEVGRLVEVLGGDDDLGQQLV